MKVEIELSALENVVRQSAFLGHLQYRHMVAPETDKVRKAEARRYLVSLGYKPKVLQEWVELGYIHEHKGVERNSPVHYSLVEIQRHLVAMEMKKGKASYIYQ